MIRLIFGKRRVGKTALNTKFAIEEIDNDYVNLLNYQQAVESINTELGTDFSLGDSRHLVFSNYTINSPCNNFSMLFDPFEFAVPNDLFDYSTYPPNSKFHIQESQLYYNSHKKVNEYTLRAFENSGHAGFDFTLDTQRPMLVSLSIRDIIDEFIFVEKLEHKLDSLGRIVKSTWYCVLFDDWSKCEQFISKKDYSLGEKIDYTFNGCIFDYYNSFDNRNAFYKTKNKKLNLGKYSASSGLNFVAPKGYWER